MGGRTKPLLLAVVIATALGADAAPAAQPWSFNCPKSISAKDAGTILGVKTKILPGAPGQCRIAGKGRTTVDLGAVTAAPAQYQAYVTNNKTGTTTHGTTGARDEFIQKSVSGTGGKAISVENKRFRAGSAKPEIRRSVFVYKRGHLLTMLAGPELSGPVPTLKQLVAIARKVAKKL